MEILFLIIGLALGFVIAFLLFRNRQTAAADTSASDGKIVALEKEKLVLATNLANAEKEIARSSAELKSLKEATALELHTAREKYAAELSAERQKAMAMLNEERQKALAELNTEKEKLSKAEARIARAEEVFRSQEERYATLKADLENVEALLIPKDNRFCLDVASTDGSESREGQILVENGKVPEHR